MKAFVLTLIGCFWAVFASAQVYVDGENINQKDIQYCQLFATNPTLLSRSFAWIDYGQRGHANNWRKTEIAGEDRKPIIFNSTMDALNFMVRNGWDLVSTAVSADKDGSTTVFTYLLRKRPVIGVVPE